MSNKINNFQIHTNSSIILFGLTISLIIVYLFFPIFAGNYYYDIGTILIYSGPLDQIPYNFALCDGNNNTPNLTNKFIIGAYTEDTVKNVESINNDPTWNKDGGNDIPFIGPGLKVDNIEPTKVDKNIEKAFSRGNLPYVFGTTYIDTYRQNPESGTTFFKKYVYTNQGNLDCEVDDGGNVIKKPYYKFNSNDSEKDKVDVCNNDKTILTDANLKDRQVQIIDPTVIGARDVDDFSQYLDINNSLELSTDTKITETYNENGTGFRHIAVNRRLFRDFEDYTLYLNGQNSNYDVLPMNKTYNYHVYDRSIYNDANNNNSSIGESAIFRNGSRFHQEYLNDFSYTTPYTNNPSFFKLAYIIKIN